MIQQQYREWEDELNVRGFGWEAQGAADKCEGGSPLSNSLPTICHPTHRPHTHSYQRNCPLGYARDEGRGVLG